MAIRNPVEKVVDLACKFVMSQKGCWNHEDWERFLQVAAKEGVPVTDESKRHLGNILEACKFLLEMPVPGPAKKAPAAPKSR